MKNTLLPDLAERRERALAWYAQKIQAEVEPQELGRILAIDLDTGDYAVADDSLSASAALRAKRPGSRIHVMAVGGGPAGRIGGRSPKAPA
jgi:hypothetical protein